jgi:hypothetical protein
MTLFLFIPISTCTAGEVAQDEQALSVFKKKNIRLTSASVHTRFNLPRRCAASE